MNALDTPKIPDPSFYENYASGGWTPPPQAKALNGQGKPHYVTYTLIAPPPNKFVFKTDKNGYWMLGISDIEVQNENYTLPWMEYLSSAPFPKRDKAGHVVGIQNRSILGNYFRAHGLIVAPRTVEEHEAYSLSTAGGLFQASLEWRAYDTETQTVVAASWEDFPEDPEVPGRKLPYVTQEDRRIWARAAIKRYIDRSGD